METSLPDRIITDHIADQANERLEITAIDDPGPGGANHYYEIPARVIGKHPADQSRLSILFQNGPIPEAGINGLTHEVLLAIVADRLRGFQTGPYACKENEQALLSIEEALESLKKRTRDRIKRGVEGKREV